MTKPDRRTRIALIVTVTLVVFAYVLRALGMCDFYSHEVGVARSFIYIGIFTAWGLSLRNRIIQTQVRRYMTAAAVLMVFWFVGQNSLLWCGFFSFFLPAFLHLVGAPVHVTLKERFPLPLSGRDVESSPKEAFLATSVSITWYHLS